MAPSPEATMAPSPEATMAPSPGGIVALVPKADGTYVRADIPSLMADDPLLDQLLRAHSHLYTEWAISARVGGVGLFLALDISLSIDADKDTPSADGLIQGALRERFPEPSLSIELLCSPAPPVLWDPQDQMKVDVAIPVIPCSPGSDEGCVYTPPGAAEAADEDWPEGCGPGSASRGLPVDSVDTGDEEGAPPTAAMQPAPVEGGAGPCPPMEFDFVDELHDVDLQRILNHEFLRATGFAPDGKDEAGLAPTTEWDEAYIADAAPVGASDAPIDQLGYALDAPDLYQTLLQWANVDGGMPLKGLGPLLTDLAASISEDPELHHDLTVSTPPGTPVSTPRGAGQDPAAPGTVDPRILTGHSSRPQGGPRAPPTVPSLTLPPTVVLGGGTRRVRAGGVAPKRRTRRRKPRRRARRRISRRPRPKARRVLRTRARKKAPRRRTRGRARARR